MKWFLIIVLILVIMLIAIGVSNQYKERFEFLNQLKQFFLQFKLNLSFKQEKIEQFVQNFKADKNFNLLLQSYLLYIQGKELNLTHIKFLEDEERKEIEEMLISLGTYNTKSEIEQLDAYINIVDSKLTKSHADKQKICPMVIKLSLLFAIALAILLI